ncbi:MAG: AraC family transcriptional regulator [Rhodoferax sp.]
MTPTCTARSASAPYAQRMNRVLDHIDHHLDQALEVADLAAVAHFSPFHFHRMFSAWVGQPLGAGAGTGPVAAGRLLWHWP